jgi:hypothetical protein
MTFDMNASQRVAAQGSRADSSERQQVGARVTKATYRQLKARAALQGGVTFKTWSNIRQLTSF